MEATRGGMQTPTRVEQGDNSFRDTNQDNHVRSDIPPIPTNRYQQVPTAISADRLLEQAKELRASQNSQYSPDTAATLAPRNHSLTVAGTPHPSGPLPTVNSGHNSFRVPDSGKNPEHCTVEELLGIIRSIDEEFSETKASHIANRDRRLASIDGQISSIEADKAAKEAKRDAWERGRRAEYQTLTEELNDKEVNHRANLDDHKESALKNAMTPSGNPIEDLSFIPDKTAKVEAIYRKLLRELEDDLVTARHLAELGLEKDLETHLPAHNIPIEKLERRIQELQRQREEIIKSTDEYITEAKKAAEAHRAPYIKRHQQIINPKARGKRKASFQRAGGTGGAQGGMSAPPKNSESAPSGQGQQTGAESNPTPGKKTLKNKGRVLAGAAVIAAAGYFGSTMLSEDSPAADNDAQAQSVELQEDTRTALDQTKQYVEAALTNPAVAVKDPAGLELNLFNGQNYIKYPGENGEIRDFPEDDGQTYDFVLKAVMAGVLEQKVAPSEGYTSDVIPLNIEYAKQVAPELGITDFNPRGYNSPQNVALFAAKDLNQTALELGSGDTPEELEKRQKEYQENPRKYYEHIVSNTYGITEPDALKQIVDLCLQMQQEALDAQENQEPAQP